jgi:hypothetical protein
VVLKVGIAWEFVLLCNRIAHILERKVTAWWREREREGGGCGCGDGLQQWAKRTLVFATHLAWSYTAGTGAVAWWFVLSICTQMAKIECGVVECVSDDAGG